ncbi:MAG TPA: hypothetical protein VGT98_11765 [Candidatus Elarobacter sp.]|nr:hypothetical protein [Candidatus Elarobacter sp.]
MLDAFASRRAFVTRMAALVGASALFPASAVASAELAERDRAHTRGDETEPWLASLTGKHKQIFHAHDNWTNGLEYAKRFKTAYAKEYGVDAAAVNSVLAAHGKTGASTYNDAAWEKYEIGRRFEVKDPKTDKPATRNIYLESDVDVVGVRDALGAGVIVLSCRTALRGFAGWMAAETKYGTKEEIERDLTASLVPGVVLVPAMIIAISRAQEHGCTYQFTG